MDALGVNRISMVGALLAEQHVAQRLDRLGDRERHRLAGLVELRCEGFRIHAAIVASARAARKRSLGYVWGNRSCTLAKRAYARIHEAA
mgnify:CR=1 FL=1